MVIAYLIGATTVVFGIAALILSSRAITRLSDGLLKQYVINFTICLAFIVIFSLWRTVRDYMEAVFGITRDILIAEYIIIVGAYIGFIVASYRVVQISHEFGFRDEGESIKKVLEEKKL